MIQNSQNLLETLFKIICKKVFKVHIINALNLI